MWAVFICRLVSFASLAFKLCLFACNLLFFLATLGQHFKGVPSHPGCMNTCKWMPALSVFSWWSQAGKLPLLPVSSSPRVWDACCTQTLDENSDRKIKAFIHSIEDPGQMYLKQMYAKAYRACFSFCSAVRTKWRKSVKGEKEEQAFSPYSLFQLYLYSHCIH